MRSFNANFITEKKQAVEYRQFGIYLSEVIP